MLDFSEAYTTCRHLAREAKLERVQQWQKIAAELMCNECGWAGDFPAATRELAEWELIVKRGRRWYWNSTPETLQEFVRFLITRTEPFDLPVTFPRCADAHDGRYWHRGHSRPFIYPDKKGEQ